MGQAVLRIDWLPAHALDAAAEFHESWLDEALHALSHADESLVLVLPPAPYDHSDWRRAAARDLARSAAPKRVNLVSGPYGAALEATLSYLAAAPGVTGQLLSVAGQDAR